MALIQKTKDRRPVHQKLPPRPKLIILRNVRITVVDFKGSIVFQGTAEQTKDGQYEFIATISLIQDEGKNILVDTGMGTDINGRTQLLNSRFLIHIINSFILFPYLGIGLSFPLETQIDPNSPSKCTVSPLSQPYFLH